MRLIFSRFDPVKKNIILYSLPKQDISTDIQKNLSFFYDKYLEEDSNKDVISYDSGPYLSYIFKKESAWDPKLKETFMLTLYFVEHENTHFFKSIIEETISNLQKVPNLTKIISVNTPHADNEAFTIFGKVVRILTNCYFEASKKHATYNLGLSEVLILGDKGSGKTSIVDYLIHGKFIPQSTPTLTPQIFQLVYDQVDFRVLDICCDEHLQEIFEDHPIEQGILPQAIVYVVDAAQNENQLKKSVEKFNYWINFLKKQYNKAVFHTIPFLVLFNKKDLNPDFYIEIYKEMYTLEDSNLNLKYAATSTKTGEGLNENFSWLLKQIKVTETF